MSLKLLFICSRNRWRSPTAERIFGGFDGIETLSAGTSPDAETPLDADLIEWADVILVMEPAHRKRINSTFGTGLRDKRFVCLNIPDDYQFMDNELIRLLWDRVPQSVPELVVHRPPQ